MPSRFISSLPLVINKSMASLLEGGASGVAVEFVQDGCNQSEGYVDDSSNTHGQEAGTVRSSLPGSVHLHHTVVQSMGGAIQQHPIGTQKNKINMSQ